MLIKVTPHLPELTCYHCGAGDSDIVAICHHCQRPICRQCGPSPIPRGNLLIPAGNNEFTDMDVKGLSEDQIAAHCQRDAHFKRSWENLFLGLFILTALAVPVLRAFEAHIYLYNGWIETAIALALSLLVLFFATHFAFKRPINRSAPLPVVGQHHEAKVTEKIKGSVSLTSSGQYSVAVQPPGAEFEFSLQFVARDKERIAKYRQKYRSTPSHFEAGFVFLEGAENVTFENPGGGNILRLAGRIADHPFFRDELRHRWSQIIRYSFALKGGGASGLPIQIFPTLVSEGDSAWGIALVVQTPPRFNNKSIERPEVKELLLRVPPQWGDTDSRNPFADFSNHVVTWKDVKLQQIQLDEQQGKQTTQAQGYQQTFYVRFSESVNQPPQETISGRLVVQFEGALSGLRNIRLFNALGYETKISTALKKQTIVTIFFRFNLSSLCLRRLVSYPSHFEEPRLIPDDELITELVKVMSNNNVYIKRVLENSPQLSRADAQMLNHYWVIIGRRYEGVFPIDFRVVVSGQACYGDSDTAISGKTYFDVTTQAVITNESMNNRVEALRRDLEATIEDVAERLRREDEGAMPSGPGIFVGGGHR